MAHISLETVYELWDNLEEHSWSGFRQVLSDSYYENSVESTSGVNAQTIDTLADMARHLDYMGNPFPKSAEQLYHVINANFGFKEELRRRV